ncbi:hypothetical protein P4O66_001376 [Electrophorus voltai]|uniref:CREB regulated transcription coactivator 2 n=1 Tax=Electrophorus voltai TaxID=2609070 RepID=A0AAD8ZAX5_9TELE|nr:hypothetical protein P4O66_001376 [Electrophorus voltai]
MSAAGAGGCGPGPGPSVGPGSGASNPRKFSEKIALHTQRQAEETAAFQEVMMDITSTRIQAQKLRLARTQGLYYGGSLPNVNQIGRNNPDLQGPLHSNLDSSRSTRHHGLVERVHRDRRFISPSRPYRRQLPLLSSRPKSCEVPGITIFPSPDQQSGAPHVPSALNTGGSLPDLSSLHFPSPLPTPLDPDEPGYPSLSGGSSTGNLASTLTQLGINTTTAFHSPGLLASLQGTLSNPSLQSSLSNPNIQSSLSSQSFPNSLSSTSLQSSLSNPSIQSSLSSSPSMQSSLSNQSLHSSLSNSSLSGQSLQSAANTVAGSGPCLGSFPPHLPGQVQPPLATSPRKRTQLSPLNLPMGPESRRHHSKQFSPISSPTLSAITQGVPLDTSKLMMDQRLPPYPYSQSQHVQSADAQKSGPSPQSGPATAQQQHHHHHQHAAQPQQHHPHRPPGHLPSSAMQLHMHNMQNLRKSQNLQQQQQQQQRRRHGPQLQAPQEQPSGGNLTEAHGQAPAASQDPATPLGPQPRANSQAGEHEHQSQSLPQLQHANQSLASDLGLYSDSLLLNSLLDDPYLGLQLTGRQNQTLSQQFNIDSQVEGLCFNHNLSSGNPNKAQDGSYHSHQGVLDLLESTEQQFLNPNQNQGYGSGRHTVPNIILTGDSPPSLSKEITTALSGVPGFEVDPFSSDDPLRMDPLALDGFGMLADGELMLADPAVEDSFRSDRLK